MSGLGVLEELNPVKRILPKPVSHPGSSSVPTLATETQASRTKKESVADAVSRAAVDAVRRAERLAAEHPSSTTFSALAQAYGSGSTSSEDAVRAARKALESGLRITADGRLADAVSVRIAAETLARHGQVEMAYKALQTAPKTESLAYVYSALASTLGRHQEAADVLVGIQGPIAEAFRGYIAAREARWSEAVHHLRKALKSEPSDVDSLLNLSVSLWNLGSARKATRAALQATRVAPGRKDASLHYLELLLAQGRSDEASAEVRLLQRNGITQDAKLMTVEARAAMIADQTDRALQLLRRAADAARREGDDQLFGEVAGNLVVYRWQSDRVSRDEALDELVQLMDQVPKSEVVVLKYAQLANRRRHASRLRAAMGDLPNLPQVYEAYLRYQLANLEGDGPTAAQAAREWFDSERDNPGAAAAAIVSIGIGQENWSEAAVITEYALKEFPSDEYIVNNGSYVLAMAGRAEEAISALEAIADRDFVLTATLGLAYLAKGEIREGMRLYREAADDAERVDPAWRSLMTAYQTMVVRQLGLSETVAEEELAALSLPPVELPDDWEDRVDFVRVKALFKENGYAWPPALNS